MKGCPESPNEPKGVSYQRVNALIGAVPEGISREQLIGHLGEPDEIRKGDTNAPKEIQHMMDKLAGGHSVIQWADPQGFEEVLVYQDPYRPRKKYLFGLRRGQLTQKWQETSA